MQNTSLLIRKFDENREVKKKKKKGKPLSTDMCIKYCLVKSQKNDFTPSNKKFIHECVYVYI